MLDLLLTSGPFARVKAACNTLLVSSSSLYVAQSLRLPLSDRFIDLRISV